jgi:hypothetical protein
LACSLPAASRYRARHFPSGRLAMLPMVRRRRCIRRRASRQVRPDYDDGWLDLDDEAGAGRSTAGPARERWLGRYHRRDMERPRARGPQLVRRETHRHGDDRGPTRAKAAGNAEGLSCHPRRRRFSCCAGHRRRVGQAPWTCLRSRLCPPIRCMSRHEDLGAGRTLGRAALVLPCREELDALVEALRRDLFDPEASEDLLHWLVVLQPRARQAWAELPRRSHTPATRRSATSPPRMERPGGTQQDG